MLQQHFQQQGQNGQQDVQTFEEGVYGVDAPKILPNFMKPQATSLMNTYINEEQDYIRECFSSASFKTIQLLPNNIRLKQVSKARAMHIDQNRHGDPNANHAVLLTKPEGPYFQAFPYFSDPATSLVDELKKQREEKAKQQALGYEGRPVWRPSNANPALAHSVPPPRLPLSSGGSAGQTEQNNSNCDDDNDAFKYPSFARARVAAQNREMILARKAAESDSDRRAPFFPSGVSSRRGGGLCRATRQDLPRIVATLRETVRADWEDCVADVYAGDDEIVVFEFGLHTIASRKGLLAYMNSACNLDQTISENGLRKTPELWDYAPGDGSVYFGFAPHWVVRASTESYYALNPQERPHAPAAGGRSFAGGGGAGGGMMPSSASSGSLDTTTSSTSSTAYSTASASLGYAPSAMASGHPYAQQQQQRGPVSFASHKAYGNG